jgi:phage/plasmid-associated DNA primase
MKTRQLLPFSPKYEFTVGIPRDYKKQSPNLVQEVKTRLIDNPFTDMKKRKHFLEFMARAIGGHFEDKSFGAFIGETNSGKGTWTQAMRMAFCDYVAEFNGEELLTKQMSTGDVSRDLSFMCEIYNKRVAFSNDMDVGKDESGKMKSIAGNKLKGIVGGGDVKKFREVYGKPIKSMNMSCLCLMVNDMTTITPADSAVVDRAHFIQMDRSSTKEEVFDEKLFFKADGSIKSWLSGEDVQNAIVDLILEFYKDTKPTKPDWVDTVVKEYVGSTDFKEWIDENFEVQPVDCTEEEVKTYFAPAKTMHEMYCRCNQPISETKFGKNLTKAGFKIDQKKINKKNV